MESNKSIEEIFGDRLEPYSTIYSDKTFSKPILKHTFNNIRYSKCSYKDMFIQHVKYIDCKFEYCSFDKVIFKNVSFKNCIFYVCDFNSVLLNCEFLSSSFFEIEVTNDYPFSGLDSDDFDEDSNIIKPEIEKRGDIKNLKIIDSEMLAVEFNNINLRDSLFERVSFQMVSFKNKTRLTNAKFIKPYDYFDISFDNSDFTTLSAVLNEFTVFPSLKQIKKVKNLSNIIEYIEYIKEFLRDKILNDFMREQERYKTPRWFNELYIVEKIRDLKIAINLLNEETISDYKSNAETYFSIANQFKLNGLESEYGEHYFIAKKLRHKILKGFKKFSSFLASISCGYGEKWWNGLITSLIFIVSSSIVYMLDGLKVSDIYTIEYHLPTSIGQILETDWGVFISDFWDCLYFSMMTFTTVGYGNMEAVGIGSELVSFAQMFIGVILIAITTGSLLRRLFR
ncbi:hypothetical protein JYG23_08160 [Sedimentibacter sp. zth1]|uniref:potassium channel family protein n=1 Tax=Sedimentibacter sp. zth1 TaxID=2816908 RepID=UPI001A90ED13|nr:potassium channel family protein [Sedimentibacter sp. zth1]QSX04682.1 hypothetical protein JYG23_08160 [Sedimentibacter sp. zth1]